MHVGNGSHFHVFPALAVPRGSRGPWRVRFCFQWSIVPGHSGQDGKGQSRPQGPLRRRTQPPTDFRNNCSCSIGHCSFLTPRSITGTDMQGTAWHTQGWVRECCPVSLGGGLPAAPGPWRAGPAAPHLLCCLGTFQGFILHSACLLRHWLYCFLTNQVWGDTQSHSVNKYLNHLLPLSYSIPIYTLRGNTKQRSRVEVTARAWAS